MEEDLGRVQGWAGWSPVPAIADRGDDKVMVIADFVGGEDNKPTSEIGKYVGLTGLVTDIVDAVPLPKGATGEKPKMNSTSITSNVIGTGAKTFILVTPIDLVVGQVAKAYSLADPNNYVCGYITNISPTSIEINVSEIGGTGTKTDWVITLGAFRGTTGITTPNLANGTIAGRYSSGTGSAEQVIPVGLQIVNDGKIYNGMQMNASNGYGLSALNNPTLAGFHFWGAAQVGVLRLETPYVSGAQTVLIKGSIWSTGSNLAVEFLISLYPSSMSLSTTAIFIGGISYPVRWYTDGAKKYIYIGDLTTSWQEKAITIDYVQSSLTGVSTYATGWIFTLQTAFVGTLNATRLASQNLPNSNLNQIVSEYNAASGVDTSLTNGMSVVQMFQNLQKQSDNRYTKAQGDLRYLPKNIQIVTPIGYLISTDIPQKSGDFFLLELKGNGYSVNLPIDIILQGYISASSDFVWCKAVSSGYSFDISCFYKGGFVCFWIPALSLNSSIIPYLYTATVASTVISPRAITLTSEVKPTTGVTAEITITPVKTLLNNGLASNLILGDGTSKPVSDFILATQKGVANGVVPLNASTLIDQIYLPSYVDDIIEGYKSGANFYKEVGLTTLITGETGKIYVDLTTGQNSKQYRWSGSVYIQITNGLIASTNDVSEGGSNLYFTVARVLATVLTGFSSGAGTVAATDTILQAINKIVGNISALQTAIDAKVADNLTASTTVAPSKTAVNTALALKADIAASTGTLVALTFVSDSVQGTIASPLTGNITGNITGAKLGVVTLVIHNHTTAPTFDSKYKKLSGSGSYVTGSINYIFCEYINDTEIIYSINQRT